MEFDRDKGPLLRTYYFFRVQEFPRKNFHPKNKKIKIYYLKDSGIELYPLLYELSLWSKKNLDMKFHPLSIDWYKAIEGRKPKEVIFEISSSYKAFRKGILNEMVA